MTHTQHPLVHDISLYILCSHSAAVPADATCYHCLTLTLCRLRDELATLLAKYGDTVREVTDEHSRQVNTNNSFHVR